MEEFEYDQYGRLYATGHRHYKRLSDLEAALSHSGDDDQIWQGSLKDMARNVYTQLKRFKDECPCACPGKGQAREYFPTSDGPAQPDTEVDAYLKEHWPRDDPTFED